MKTLIATALVAATAAVAAPAAAQQVGVGTAAAIAHFNQSREVGDRVVVQPDARQGVTVSTRSRGVADVYAHFNESADSMGDLIGQGPNVTAYSGTPAYGAEIFARLEAEKAEDQ